MRHTSGSWKQNEMFTYLECPCDDTSCDRSGWYFYLFNEWHGPFATQGEASTELQTLKHNIKE